VQGLHDETDARIVKSAGQDRWRAEGQRVQRDRHRADRVSADMVGQGDLRRAIKRPVLRRLRWRRVRRDAERLPVSRARPSAKTPDRRACLHHSLVRALHDQGFMHAGLIQCRGSGGVLHVAGAAVVFAALATPVQFYVARLLRRRVEALRQSGQHGCGCHGLECGLLLQLWPAARPVWHTPYFETAAVIITLIVLGKYLEGKGQRPHQ